MANDKRDATYASKRPATNGDKRPAGGIIDRITTAVGDVVEGAVNAVTGQKGMPGQAADAIRKRDEELQKLGQ